MILKYSSKNFLQKQKLHPFFAAKRHFTQNQLAAFRNMYENQSFVVISNALSQEELHDLKQWTEELEDNTDILHHYEETNSGDVRLCRSEKIVDYHSGFDNMLNRGKIKDVVENILDESYTLYKEKINYKYPNAGWFRPHQDAPAYDHSDYHVTALVSIDDATEESGCLEFAKNWSDSKREFYEVDSRGIIAEDKVESLDWIQAPTKAGDIVLFSSYVPHRSGVNRSDNPRRVLYATFNQAEKGDFRKTYYMNKEKNMAEGRISFIFDFTGKIV